jgi:diaminopimelate epimerase
VGSGSVVYKMSGSGNDFVMLDGRLEPISRWPVERIRAVCARRTGVGADGLVFLEPGSGPGAVRFVYFNADGSPAGMCGNAALCATRLAGFLELAPAQGMVLETDAGDVRSRCLDDKRAEIELPDPGPLTVPAIDLASGERDVRFTTVGVPHLVLLVDDLAAVRVRERGRELRSHPAVQPDGANVNFLAPAADGAWAVRTYERGVEDETLACGTGTAASAATLLTLGKIRGLPLEVRTSSGLILTVTATLAADGRLERPRLAGEGRFIFRGIISQ